MKEPNLFKALKEEFGHMFDTEKELELFLLISKFTISFLKDDNGRIWSEINIK